ncbi:hypothetical protein [Paenirhodobacter sp. CAU 1674]|uniref:hypothetical protein n=1 Tax=Paenirhodobacter sp. CAU 1674 TaxID=3032596 RepID=UPI0023DB61E2|nr:hypothetical protein [Paenirhodobacter sp. CAU 1674]MDF2140810.1 hypothetical protein [Paenirhodobacter sp. CAU 1674]
MTEQRACANDTGFPKEVLDRLATFAAATGTTAPECLTEGVGEDRTFSDELLMYCLRTGLSLDWLWFGEGETLADRRVAQ